MKRPKTAPRFVPRKHSRTAPSRTHRRPESPDPNGDAQDVLVLVPPDLKPDEQDEPAPVMGRSNGTTDSAVAESAQGAFAFDSEETGNGAGDVEPVSPPDGKNDAPGTEETDPPPGPQADAGAAVAENEEAAPGSEETETAQSKGRPKLGWTNI